VYILAYCYIHSLLYIVLFRGIFVVNCHFTGSEHIAGTSCGIPYLDQMSALCQDETDHIVSCSDVQNLLGVLECTWWFKGSCAYVLWISQICYP